MNECLAAVAIRQLNRPEALLKSPKAGVDVHRLRDEPAEHLRPNAASFPKARAPWLKPDPIRRATLRAALPPGAGLRCGLSRRSQAATLVSRKSVPLKARAEVVAPPGVQLVCQQYGVKKEELMALRQETGIEVLGLAGLDLRNDLESLAPLISCCNLVITISNAIGHISGALGKATWLLLHQVPDWPWRLEGPTTPWQPSLRLFRQNQAGDWRESLGRLRTSLLHQLQIAGWGCPNSMDRSHAAISINLARCAWRSSNWIGLK
ncbi:MAG: hypothetical protein VKO39_07585 [Cyanobacteriota bacterium]|nr:hypothetical protein [Cyanobacteriota bacterium]